MGSHLAVRLFITGYLIILLTIGWVVSWIFQVLLMFVTFPFKSREWQQDWCGLIFRYANHICADVLNPFWTVRIIRPLPKVHTTKQVLMMNHLSNADPFLLVRALFPGDASWVAKDVLFRVPFGGWGIYNADDLKVCFKDKRLGFETVKGTVGVMMEVARQKLRRGRRLAVFPEGIRSTHPEGGLLPFRLGFFTLAIEEAATVVPIAVSGTEHCWPRSAMLVDFGTAYISCGDPIDAGQFKTAEELRDYVWDAITKLRDAHPDRQGQYKRKED